MVSLKKNGSFVFFAFLLTIYSFLKIYRNTINFYNTKQGGIWNYLLIGIIAISVIYLLVFGRQKKSNIFHILILYIVFVYANGLLTLKGVSLNSLYMIITVPSFAFVIMLGYFSGLKGYSGKTYRLFVLLWLPILIFILYAFFTFYSNYSYRESGGKLALNISYYAISFIPFLLFKKQKKINIIMLIICIAITFISNKRAGIIALGLGFIGYYFLGQALERKASKKFRNFCLGFIILFLAIFVFIKIDSNFSLGIYDRLINLLDDGGSGRTEIYKSVFISLQESNFGDIILGHGVDSISILSYTSAHNDFLNILYEYGLVPLILVLTFYMYNFYLLIKMVKNKYKYAPAFGFSLIVSFIFSMFSSNLDDQLYSIILAFFWGLLYADFLSSEGNVIKNGTKFKHES